MRNSTEPFFYNLAIGILLSVEDFEKLHYKMKTQLKRRRAYVSGFQI